MADFSPTHFSPSDTTSSTTSLTTAPESPELRDPERDSTTLDRDQARILALLAAEAGDDRKAVDILILDVAEVAYLADYFVIMSGLSPVQVKAIARAVEDKLATVGRSPLRQEGFGDSRWILQDYGDVIIHIFMPREREFYNLEAFWGHAPVVPWHPSIAG